MSSPPSTSQGAVLAALPTAIVAGFLFFMPWIEVSCDPSAASADQPLAMQDVPISMEGPTVVGQISGWQLARGEMTCVSEEETLSPDNQEMPPGLPKARFWMYGGIALPVVGALLAAAGLMGMHPLPSVGKILLVVGLAGGAMVLLASRTSVAGDLLSEAKGDMPGGSYQARRMMKQAMSDAQSQFDQVLPTRCTAYLWGSLGLYGLLAGCGAVLLVSPPEVTASQPLQGRAVASRKGPVMTTTGDIAAAGEQIFQPDEGGGLTGTTSVRLAPRSKAKTQPLNVPMDVVDVSDSSQNNPGAKKDSTDHHEDFFRELAGEGEASAVGAQPSQQQQPAEASPPPPPATDGSPPAPRRLGPAPEQADSNTEDTGDEDSDDLPDLL